MVKLPHPDAQHLDRAEGWLGLGNHLEANEELENIAPQNRVHPQVLEIRWRIYARERKWNACLDIAAAMVMAAMDLPEGWIYRSTSLRELERQREAYEQLEAAADLFPSVWTIPYDLARYACLTGRPEEAREWLQDAFELAPDPKLPKLRALDDPDLGPLWVNETASLF